MRFYIHAMYTLVFVPLGGRRGRRRRRHLLQIALVPQTAHGHQQCGVHVARIVPDAAVQHQLLAGARVRNLLHAAPAHRQLQLVGGAQLGDTLAQPGQRPRFEDGSAAAAVQALNGQELAFGVAGSGQHVVQNRADDAEFGARRAQLVWVGAAVGVRATGVERRLFDGLDLGAERGAAPLHGQPFGVVLDDGLEDGLGALPQAG